jgi:hypothetical protein
MPARNNEQSRERLMQLITQEGARLSRGRSLPDDDPALAGIRGIDRVVRDTMFKRSGQLAVDEAARAEQPEIPKNPENN